MATKLRSNGVCHGANSDTKSSSAESQAVLELLVGDNLQANELSEMLAALSWLHETFAGHPAKIETILIN